MKTRKLREDVYQFLCSFKMAALATVDAHGRPHVATVYCVADKELNIFFTSSTKGRKFENMMVRPEVAMVITDEDSLSTVQLSGRAESREGTEIEADILKQLWRLRFDEPAWPVPPIKMFEQRFSNEMTVIQVTPSEMTFAKFSPTQTGTYTSYFHKVI